MEHYRKTSHSVYDIKYYLVWIAKYRKKVLVGPVGERCRELLRQICKSNDIEILKGHVSKDHVHMFVSVPPYLAVSKLMQLLKGKSSHKMLREFKPLQKSFYGKHLWAKGYFAASSGNVTDEVIMDYIERQDIEGDDNFKVSG